jgi:hypothetical protein
MRAYNSFLLPLDISNQYGNKNLYGFNFYKYIEVNIYIINI